MNKKKKMKNIFLLILIVLSVIPLVLAVPVSYKGVIDYTGNIATGHVIKAVSDSRTTTKTITESSFVVNHLVKKGEIVKFYFDDNLFTEYTQPLPGTVVDLGTWKISPAGITSDLYKAKSDLTYELILNGNPSKDSVISNLYLPTSLVDYTGTSISWASNHGSIAINGTVTRDNSDHTITLNATLSKTGEADVMSTFTLTVKQKVNAINQTIITVSYNQPEIVIDNTNGNTVTNIEIPETVSANEIVSLNLKAVMDVDNKVTVGINDLKLIRKTNSTVNYSAEIPSGTEIKGPADWNGLINLPTVKDKSEVTSAGTTELVIEMGYVNGQLNFSNAVKVILSGMTGKKAGYTHGTDVTTISLVCNSAIDSNNIVGNGECYYDDTKDLIIWTKHFTKFAAYTPTPVTTTTTPPTGDTGGGGGGGGYVPRKVVEEITEELPEEEITEEELTEELPEEVIAPPTETALNKITGAVVGAAKGFIQTIWTKVLGGVIIAFIVIYLLYTVILRSGAPLQLVKRDHNWYYNRASLLHREADELYKKGKYAKSQKLFKKAQIYREKGEQKVR